MPMLRSIAWGVNPLPRRDFISKAARSLAAVQLGLQGGMAFSQAPSASLRVSSVAPASTQPHSQDKSVIFYDDFAKVPEEGQAYFEYVDEKGSFLWTADEGLAGGAMRCQFEKGQVSAGRLHVLFGKNPFERGLQHDETFREIYWRVYVKHEAGWEGNPAKLARCTCMAGRDYSQGFIAHVWGGRGDALCIDPATGIRDGQKITTRYNDFDRLKWLGSRNGPTPVFSASESGRWVCIESHIKLNTPGQSDGVFELWVDGKIEATRVDLDWHGTWTEYAINAVFLENYWNQGSVKRQSRWFDNFVISTKPIGPIIAASPVKISRTQPALELSWEVEISPDLEGRDIVWKSKPVEAKAGHLIVDAEHGGFAGTRSGKSALADGVSHWLRVREIGASVWSPWHAPFIYSGTPLAHPIQSTK